MADNDATKKFNAAQRFFSEGDFDHALVLLKELNAEFPNTKNVLLALARCYAELKDFDNAVPLCETCIRHWNAPRAASLLASIKKEQEQSDEVQIEEVELDTGLSAAFEAQAVPPKTLAEKLTKPILLLVAAVSVVAGIVFGVQKIFEFEPDTGVSSDEFQRALDERRGHTTAKIEQHISERPGQIIPEHVWRQTAIDDRPDWRPGIYQKVPCGDAHIRMPDGSIIPRDIDVYIPMAYQERPNEWFPVVTINWSSRNPGFQGLERWAEKNDVILVTFNAIANKFYKIKDNTQDAALYVIVQSMRANMAIALGMSGGAASCWEMICRYPDNFAGVVMMAMSDGHNDCMIPNNVRVGYIYGQSDHNRKAIERKIPQLEGAGFRVRSKVVRGGHVTGPLSAREEMLTWILEDVRAELGHNTGPPDLNLR